MGKQAQSWTRRLVGLLGGLAAATLTACQAPPAPLGGDAPVAIARYEQRRAEQLTERFARGRLAWAVHTGDPSTPRRDVPPTWPQLAFHAEAPAPTTAPTTAPATESDAADPWTPPDGYWRRNVWHQMGYEAREFGTRGFWEGFKTSFWDLENAALLGLTFGASVTIRETGVDDAIRRRTDGHRQLGEFDEPIQLLGHPATHFAGAGVLWLSSALTRDVKSHEVARSLGKALAVNGVTTLALKATLRTTAPNGDQFAWPSGHTSSAFTTAAVLNEYYGPLVGVPSLALAGLVGYQRIDSRVHDFSDVVSAQCSAMSWARPSPATSGRASPKSWASPCCPTRDAETGAAGLALYKQW
jgi:membrane-associated phospholipid phosphatase